MIRNPTIVVCTFLYNQAIIIIIIYLEKYTKCGHLTLDNFLNCFIILMPPI